MAFIPVPNIVQARLMLLEDNGVVGQNVFYHACTPPVTIAQMEEIGAKWSETIVAHLVTSITGNWNWSGVLMRDMSEAEGAEINFTEGFPIAGTGSGTINADQVCYTVTWGTGLAGRSARGRSYISGLNKEVIVNNNRLSDSAQSDFQNRWTNIREDFEEIGHALQVVSFIELGVPRAEGRALPVLNNLVRFPVATQRRRLS